MYKFYYTIGYGITSHVRKSITSLWQIAWNPNIRKWFMRINLTCLILLMAFLQITLAANAQKISLSKKNAPLTEVFKELKKQSGYGFMINKERIKLAKPVTITVNGEELIDVLDKCFKDQPFTYRVEDKMIIVVDKKPEQPRIGLLDIDVKGRILDENGQPLAGANVRVKDGSKSTLTDDKGNFSIKGINEKAVLEISYLGYKTKEVSAKPDLGILVMVINTGDLDEVSVVASGYQSIPKERATGSFSKVDNATFNRQVSTDVISRLKGIAPSILFDERSGSPKLTIRGQATIFGNDQPLIVVDNFPYEGDINNINPNDIEDIDILKDAAAASIWGVRAGNGVIVIKTKRGRANQPMSIGITSNVTIGEKPDLWYNPIIASTDFIDIEKMLFDKGYYNTIISNTAANRPYSPVVEILNNQKNGLIMAQQANAQIDALRGYDLRNDMEKYLYQTTVKQQYALNLSGGTDKNSYYFSSGFDKNRNSEIGNSFDRISLNSNQVFRPIKNLELSIGLNYNQNSQSTSNVVSMLNNMGQEMMYPYARLVDDNGNPAVVIKDHSTVLKQKALNAGLLNWDFVPLDELNYQDNKVKQSEMRLNTAFKYTIIPSLSAEVRFQYENQTGKSRNLYDQDSYFTRNQTNLYTTFSSGVMKRNIPLGGILDNTNTELNALNGRLQLNYDKKWNKHQVNAIAGFEARQNKTNGVSSRLYGFDPNVGSSIIVDYISQFEQYGKGYTNLISQNNDYSETLDRIRSYYVNGAYNYDLRYVLSASARVDQSNLFGVNTNQKSVPLWSVGGKWNIDKENFYNFRWLQTLSFRSTFGYSGNVDRRVTAYTTARLTSNSINQLPAAYLVNPPNKNLSWEKNAMWNIGIDFTLKGSKLSGSVEYFSRKGTDLIGNGPIDPTTGFTSYRGNLANMKGKGLDVELNSINIQSKNFKWLTTAIFSYAKDEIIKYQRIVDISSFVRINDYSIGRTPTGYSPVVGRPLFGIYSYPWAGLNPNTGQAQGFLNGQASTEYSQITTALSQDPANNLVYNGNALAPYFGALRNTFGYKQLELSFNITYRFGYYFRRYSFINSGLQSYSVHGDYYNRWQNPGDELKTDIPALIYPANNLADNYYQFSEALVNKGDHIRLQDISLSFNLNSDFLKKLNLRNFKLFAYANNIGILWRANKVGLDPDFSIMKPIRTLALGLNCNF
ncbi:TonB-linked SusC/RagA family outer membrane protein [Pedobacter africanus]|uniref:TonB-linked SusC/RagA family outer membrane protein n=1 Tax=Pedobacter africanus TaxID=151894 RepID=A0ACC6KVA0_9SPHI|nr:SusC/RagA family TonB-linked outer membrane protein [Pedobacter africanus]MDR6783298.1 TonB-linked SusC/RagA family outer membrane protein [Pedobacter africanus]